MTNMKSELIIRATLETITYLRAQKNHAIEYGHELLVPLFSKKLKIAEREYANLVNN